MDDRNALFIVFVIGLVFGFCIYPLAEPRPVITTYVSSWGPEPVNSILRGK